LVKVGAQVLFRFQEISALKVVRGNVNEGSLTSIVWGRCRGTWLRNRVLVVVRH